MTVQQRPCVKCGVLFEPTAYQVRASYYRCSDCRRERNRLYREQRKTQGKPIWRTRMSDPAELQKHRARMVIANALRRGRLRRQPCEACGEVNAQARHDDYNKPRDVRWLCDRHHREHHAKDAA